MSDEQLEEYIKKINHNFASHIEKGTIEMSIEYYNLMEERMARLIAENQELKKQLEIGKEQYNDLVEEKEKLQEELSSKTLQFENQQKEFMKYLENEIKEVIRDAGYHQRICLEILEKYKEIMGGKDGI